MNEAFFFLSRSSVSSSYFDLFYMLSKVRFTKDSSLKQQEEKTLSCQFLHKNISFYDDGRVIPCGAGVCSLEQRDGSFKDTCQSTVVDSEPASG